MPQHLTPPRLGRQSDRIVLRRRTLLCTGALAGLAFAWAGAATWYIASRDEIATRFFARQTELRYGYEDRIANLKARLEREITHGLVERNGFAARAEALARRQSEIEARQIWLAGVAERLLGRDATLQARSAPLPAPAEPAPTPLPSAGGKPVPLMEPVQLRGTGEVPGQATLDRPADRLTAVARSLERGSEAAVRLADLFRRAAEGRAEQIRAALDGTGLETSRRMAGPDEPGTGGPLVAPPSGFDGPLFAGVMTSTLDSFAELRRLQAAVRSLPLGLPVPGSDATSGFGYRVDPFTRMPALHTGLDFRAETGDPVRVTAPGTVVVSDWATGYGNLVEVDHGRGVTTRYGHLSSIAVQTGTAVEAGQVVGRVGSTGRSTGPHLHYEVRIGGEPVDPSRFLRAGRLVGATAREGVVSR